MFKKIKIYALSVAVVLSLFSFTALNSSTNFGKRFNVDKDFTCCINGQLYVNHYYTSHLFGIRIGEGYTKDAVGTKNAETCIIECSDK